MTKNKKPKHIAVAGNIGAGKTTLTEMLSKAGEVISTLPAIDGSGGTGIAFRLLYGSMLGVDAVATLVPEGQVLSLRKADLTAASETHEVAAAETPEEDFSLRSISQTVRVATNCPISYIATEQGNKVCKAIYVNQKKRGVHR